MAHEASIQAISKKRRKKAIEQGQTTITDDMGDGVPITDADWGNGRWPSKNLHGPRLQNVRDNKYDDAFGELENHASHLYNGEKIPFVKFIEYLLPLSNVDVDGCEMLFPDTVFFNEEGLAEFIAKSDHRTGGKLQME